MGRLRAHCYATAVILALRQRLAARDAVAASSALAVGGHEGAGGRGGPQPVGVIDVKRTCRSRRRQKAPGSRLVGDRARASTGRAPL
eukprot:scaffold2213_cov444-Prasinococcus_capsulatus_cf.AAC.19